MKRRWSLAAAGLALAIAASCGQESATSPAPSAPSPSGNALLSGLTTSAGSLTPPFRPEDTDYSVAVPFTMGQVTVTPSSSDGPPTITVAGPGLPDGAAVAAGTASPPLTPAVGANEVTVTSVSEDGNATQVYRITMTRDPAPKTCAGNVNRGSPTDGVTTVFVVTPPVPCPAGGSWDGWYRTVLDSRANNNGVVYRVEARWNRVGQSAAASFTWLTGDESGAFFRDKVGLAGWVQDELDGVDGVRSIDLAFDTTGTRKGAATAPRNGYVNVSAVYADVLEHLVATGVATGVLGHFGNSGGGVLCACALANHGLDAVLDGVVFGGGPFWTDLEDNCLNTTSPVYGNDQLRGLIDDWNWKESAGTPMPCQLHNPSPSPGYECRSILGVDAVRSYPGVTVAVIVGADDMPFVVASGQDYLQQITARMESFDSPAMTPHSILESQAGADLALAHLRAIVAAGSIH